MERGGWSTDATMKQVYTHTFSKERIEVDNKIDDYFNTKMQLVEGIWTVEELLSSMSETENKLCLVEVNSKLLSPVNYTKNIVIEKYDIVVKTYFEEPTLRPILRVHNL